MGTRILLPGVNPPGHGVHHPPLSSAEVKERVELYVCPCLGLRGLLPYLDISDMLGVLILVVGKVSLKISLEFV